MKLKTPIALQVDEQRILGIPAYDRENGRISIAVAILAHGMTVQMAHVTLNASEHVSTTTTDKEGREVISESFRGSDCLRIVRNSDARSISELFRVEPFRSEFAFANAVRAMKADDEVSALESAGLADGWLMEGA